MLLASGTRLGPYEIVGRLGQGGRGDVYRARDARLGGDVAIKILPPAFCNQLRKSSSAASHTSKGLEGEMELRRTSALPARADDSSAALP